MNFTMCNFHSSFFILHSSFIILHSSFPYLSERKGTKGRLRWLMTLPIWKFLKQ